LRLPALAGWLFADLFLVLFIVGLASLPAKPPANQISPSPSPSPTPTLHQVLDRTPVSFNVGVPPASLANPATRAVATAKLIRILDQALARRHLLGRHAGFVLVFASGPVTAIGVAIDTANLVVRILRGRDQVFAGAGGAGYWTGAGDAIELKIFFFAHS